MLFLIHIKACIYKNALCQFLCAMKFKLYIFAVRVTNVVLSKQGKEMPFMHDTLRLKLVQRELCMQTHCCVALWCSMNCVYKRRTSLNDCISGHMMQCLEIVLE